MLSCINLIIDYSWYIANWDITDLFFVGFQFTAHVRCVSTHHPHPPLMICYIQTLGRVSLVGLCTEFAGPVVTFIETCAYDVYTYVFLLIS